MGCYALSAIIRGDASTYGVFELAIANTVAYFYFKFHIISF